MMRSACGKWQSHYYAKIHLGFILAALLVAFVHSTDNFLGGFKESRTIWPRIMESDTVHAGRSKRATTELHSTKKEGGVGHLNRLTLELPLDSATHVLDLQLNTDLISKGYFERTQTKNLEPVVKKPNHLETDLCQYHGRIRGIPNSWAALSTCDGLRGVVFDGSEIHYLEPGTGQAKMNSEGVKKGELPWKTLHLKDAHRLQKFNCGHKHSGDDARNPDEHFAFKLQRKKRSAVSSGFEVPYNSGVKTRYVEMVIVVDKKKYQELGSDLAKVILRTKDIANIVNTLYNPLDIFVALVGVVVWTERDAINISTKGDDTLSSFLLYRRERLLKDHPNDNAQLLTGREFEDGVVGKAMQGPICSYKYSGGVNSDYKSVIGVVATTVAHELGHNFGLSHDSDSCKCNGPDSKCIMSASSTSNRTAHWSSCSLESMKYALDHGMDHCLKNKPRSLFEPSTCGNGFVEVGEDCDCGHPEHCTNYCCNPHTCKLHSNATCAAGVCCDTSTCQLRPGGTVCRPDQSQCDLPEYCSGETEFCPSDVYKQDGLACETKNGKAHCAGGQCRTHTDQCQLLWGPTGKTSGDICYQKNVNGSRYGHCGFDLVTQIFKPCPRADIKCGILQCEHHHEKLEFGYENVAQLASFFVNVGGGTIHPCRSATTDFGLDVVDPGLVPDGAICGANKMCMNQKCVAVESVMAPLLCPNDCSGNGVCNSKGHCHCKYGHGGEDCDSGGYGGSIDSGPSVNPHGGASVFARALYVTFLGFIPLVAVISFYLYHAGDNFKRLFKRGQTVSRVQNRSKPNQNGSAGGVRPKTATSSTVAGGNDNGDIESAQPPNGVIGADLFGQYKGFSLSPIRHAPPTASATHINNNFQNSSNQNIQNQELPSLPPIPAMECQVLVKNENDKFIQKTMGRGVSWKEPVASSATISPDQDDVISNTSDTPLTSHKNPAPKIRPLSSTDALNVSKIYESNAAAPAKKNSTFGSTSALSRLAAAFPFVRSFSSESAESTNSPKASNTSLTRQRSFNRDTLEISKPILQNLAPGKLPVKLVPLRNRDLDVVDSPNSTDLTDHRYENLPASAYKSQRNLPSSEERNESLYPNLPQEEPKKSPRFNLKAKPVQRTMECIKNIEPILPVSNSNSTPSPPPLANSMGNQPKVQRAQSMIQPNRNSIVGNGQPNYNSLRRSSRPTAPPPKPPPPAEMAAIQPPPPLVTTLPLKPNSILKFSTNNSNSNTLISKAPIAKMDDSDIGSPMSSGSTPSPKNGGSKQENIYDVIDEGVAEKIETLSTGSSDGGGGGLLSDIISEIESRNKESIYNSVDRRKKKREKLKVVSEGESLNRKNENNTGSPKSPRITLNPNFQQTSPTLIRKSFQNSPPIAHKPLVGTSKNSSPPGQKFNTNSAPVKPPPPVIPNKPEPASVKQATPTPHPPSPQLTRELSPIMNGKPTCAVNGIPKTPVTSGNSTSNSPSYVAKINYFSALGGAKSDGGMKPISSLSQALMTAAADKEKDPIYAPGQLSTIRPAWSRKSSIGKGEGGIYSKPVATPTIPQPSGTNSGERSRSGSNSPVPITTLPSSSSSSSETGKGEEKTGYKSFNAYLNRPLTFSTFRPSNDKKGNTRESGSEEEQMEDIKINGNKCSSLQSNSLVNPLNKNGGVGLLTSPVQMRSPSRLVKS